ncbi:hypothetical protein HW115_16430 [Verrucomicrobiaceae bacterium N1E253]|uniref:Uncharacterized protein n=2 Tax=Oceaniferula marina TaxID=2748318 RepID=A0A851GN01_9BACT|nr:hypothetical protein [Oceaniferula marina]
MLEAQQNKQGRKISFVCASWIPMDDELYYQKTGSSRSKKPTYEEVSMSEMVRSLPYEARVEGSLGFYKRVGDEEYRKVAQVRIPTGCNRFLLLFMPKKENNYQIKVIPDDRKRSPFGAYSFYNFSRLPVKGLLGNKRFDVDAGKHKLVQLQLKAGTPLPYATQAEVDGKRQWLQRNTFHYNPKKHSKFFIYQVPSANNRYKVKCKAIVEFQQDKPKAKPEVSTP